MFFLSVNVYSINSKEVESLQYDVAGTTDFSMHSMKKKKQ